jgi:hypothetical protein
MNRSESTEIELDKILHKFLESGNHGSMILEESKYIPLRNALEKFIDAIKARCVELLPDDSNTHDLMEKVKEFIKELKEYAGSGTKDYELWDSVSGDTVLYGSGLLEHIKEFENKNKDLLAERGEDERKD